MIPVAVQKDRDLWERAFNLAPRVFSFSKMSAAILKKREDSGARLVNARLACELPANGRRISGRRFSPASFSTGNTSAVRRNSKLWQGWVSPKIPFSFPELRSFSLASWIDNTDQKDRSSGYENVKIPIFPN